MLGPAHKSALIPSRLFDVDVEWQLSRHPYLLWLFGKMNIFTPDSNTTGEKKWLSSSHILTRPWNNLVRVQAPLMEADLKIPPSSYEATVHKLLSNFTNQQVLTNKGQILTYMQSTHHGTICNLVGKPIINRVKAPPSQGDVPTLGNMTETYISNLKIWGSSVETLIVATDAEKWLNDGNVCSLMGNSQRE